MVGWTMHDEGAQIESFSVERSTLITLVAGPFTRAEGLRRFVQAIKSIPGVSESRILALKQGMLSLAVTYADAVPLLERLRTMNDFSLEVARRNQASITLGLRDPSVDAE